MILARACVTGETRNAETGLCDCTVNCATGATCTEDLTDNSYSCTCDAGYDPDSSLTSQSNYYCTGWAALLFQMNMNAIMLCSQYLLKR